MTRSADIAAHVQDVRRRIAKAAGRAGRSEDEINLVAVSKTWPAGDVVDAARAGVTDFGENRAQELTTKASLIDEDVTWHFVGALQSNKVRHVVGLAHLIHSIDDLRLAEVVARRASAAGMQQEVLVEVNLSGEATKRGVGPEDAVDLAVRMATLDGLVVRGLMSIPAWPDDPEESRPAYKALADLGGRLRTEVPSAGELSMGMTRDFEVAIEEGATIVRVGEAIFGPRTASVPPG